jgi:hypothetical protein
MELTNLSASELLTTLDTVWSNGNRTLAQLLAYLGEVERRGLHEKMGCSSMFAFLERRFGLTGGSAYRRLTAARLVRRFPTLLARIERGDIHIEALCALKEVLTEANVEEVMAATAKKTLREVEHIVACRSPRPDAQGSIRKMPERQAPAALTSPAVPVAPVAATVVGRMAPVDGAPSLFDVTAAPVAGSEPMGANVVAPSPVTVARAMAARPRVEQLSESRHKVQLTVSTTTRAKIERARDLMKHRNPTGDLEILFDRAMDALLEQLEKERLGKTARPQSKPRPSQPGHISQATRREVFERDGERCTFVAEDGTRCAERGMLELDHVRARARGGPDDASNLRVRCRGHNQMHAREVFGEAYVARKIHFRQRKCGPSP